MNSRHRALHLVPRASFLDRPNTGGLVAFVDVIEIEMASATRFARASTKLDANPLTVVVALRTLVLALAPSLVLGLAMLHLAC